MDTQYTERTFTLLLKKYGLQLDSDRLWRAGVRNPQHIDCMQEEDLVDYRLTGTWAQYLNMYKQETGKDHEDPYKAA
jgi:hypothetical protein